MTHPTTRRLSRLTMAAAAAAAAVVVVSGSPATAKAHSPGVRAPTAAVGTTGDGVHPPRFP
jgi:hypothetical protein